MQQVESSRTSSSWRAQAVFPPTVRAAQATSELTWGPAALEQRRQRTREHLAKIAPRRESWIKRNSYYYKLLGSLLRFLVEPQKKCCRFAAAPAIFWLPSGQVEAKASISAPRSWTIAQQRNPSLEFRSRFPGQGRVPAEIQAR